MALDQKQLELLSNNPQRAINYVVDEIENNWFNGTVRLNSKSHPAVLCMDLIFGTTHGFLNQLSDATSKVFLKHARNVSDLSRNMADEERAGLFANPSESMLQFAISEAAFMENSVEYTVGLGKSTLTYRKLLIPKDSTFDVNGYSFANNNGVEIRYSEKSGWSAVYDETTNNPFDPISTNLVQKEIPKVVNGTTYHLFSIPVKQLSIQISENNTSNEASGCRGTITYQDYLYTVRAFLFKDGVLKEINVSYDQAVFAPLSVTLAIDLDTVNKTINFEIPDVYILNKLGIGTLRVYVYTTKGELTKDLRATPTANISANYQDFRYGSGKLDAYASPLRNMSGLAWVMSAVATGGSNPTDFNTMKQALISGRRARVLPITENNLAGLVESYGYNSVKAIDFVTGRTFSLTKELPIQDNKGLYAPMSCYVGSHLASVNNLVGSGVVLDNGKRITIPHNVLFDITNPAASLVTSLRKAQYLSMSKEGLIDTLSNLTLVYTPFYYVMDLTSNQATLRTYHLDSPAVNTQTFVAEDPTLGFELGVGAINISHTDTGYVIQILTQSNDAYKTLDHDQVGLQLSIASQDSTSLANMKADLVGLDANGERIFQLVIDSKFDVDVNDVIYFTNFSQFGQVQPSTGSKLSFEMTFIFTYTGDPDVTKSDSNAKIDSSLFDQDMVAVIETRYSVTLGKRLGNLYSRIRPLIGEAQYKRYTADVALTYPETTYLKDQGQMVFDNVTGQPIVEHRAGDIQYNSDGSTRLAFRKGDVVIDPATGKPVEVAPRDLQYHFDYIAFDGNYFFSDDTYDKEFALATKNFYVDVISKDMEAFTSRSINQTNLFYQPRSKLGYQKVVVNSNYESFLKQDLSFTVTYYLTATGYKNQNLKDALNAATPQVINVALFGKTTIGVTNFVRDLLDGGGTDVVTVTINALSGDSTVDVISNVDANTGFSVRKELALTGDGSTYTKEMIDVIFLPHDISTTNVSFT